jgi:hypothetical protein
LGIGVYGFTLDWSRMISETSLVDKTWAISFAFYTRMDEMFRF